MARDSRGNKKRYVHFMYEDIIGRQVKLGMLSFSKRVLALYIYYDTDTLRSSPVQDYLAYLECILLIDTILRSECDLYTVLLQVACLQFIQREQNLCTAL